MSFQKLSIEEYQQLLESKKSTPSGGSALALTLETASSLCLMVCNLTVDKKGYEGVSDIIQEYIALVVEIKEEAKKLMDEDSIAFDSLMDAFRSKDKNEIHTQTDCNSGRFHSDSTGLHNSARIKKMRKRRIASESIGICRQRR
jgi:formiminotetrahydrofolate cyclodeaminase